MVNRYLDLKKFIPAFLFTERKGHAYQLVQSALSTNIDIIVAVGGDGTVNEVASALNNTNIIMGIIPYGSGNGLARTMGIPMSEKQAIKRLNNLSVDRIDSGVFNNHYFFGVAGMGFDAHISACFAASKIRGLLGYLQIAFAEIINYKTQRYQINVDGNLLERQAFIISIANSSQYGNNAYISPMASVKDGLLDVCIIKQFPWYYLPMLGYHLFNKTAHKSKYIEIIQGKNIKINRDKSDMVHLDGEPLVMQATIEIGLKSRSLQVLS